jgi:hypothetical protein
MHCPRGGDVRAFLMSLRTKRNEIRAAGAMVSDEEYERTILRSIPGELAKFASNAQNAAEISNTTLSMTHLIQYISEEADRIKSHRAHHQQGPGKGKNVDQVDEALAATDSSGNRDRRRKRHPGNCHNCGKAGHWVRECRSPKKEESADMPSTPKPETRPVGLANTVSFMDNEGDGFWMVEEMAEEVAPAHIVSTEPDPILHALDNFEGPPANFDAPKELFWGDDPASWLGAEGDEWDLEEVADTDEEGAEAAITPTVEEIICSEPSAQLEGEKTKSLTVESEQRAARDTPTTSRLATFAGLTLMQSTAPGHESPPTSAPPQPR